MAFKQHKNNNHNKLRGFVEIDLGMDNFCYINTKNYQRVDLTDWMKRFDGKDVEIQVKVINGGSKDGT